MSDSQGAPVGPPPRPARADRTWLYVGLAFVVFWVGYLRFFGVPQQGDEPRLEGTGLTEPADYRWQLKDLDGKTVEFSEFRGRPVFLNVWATWCPPCVSELPSIARLAADPSLEGVAFVCASVDDDAATIRRFLDARGQGWKMTVLHARDLPPVFRTEGIPATFLINGDGQVVASEIGYARWDGPAVRDFLLRLKKGGAKSPQ